MIEEWRPIVGYEGLYEVSNTGLVRSTKRQESKGGIIKNRCSKKFADKYLYIRLCKDGIMKSYWIHRLVAQAFIENKLGLPLVNHKDQNPYNNRVDNLEWCNYEYNNNYGTVRKRQYDTCIEKGIWYTDYSYLLKTDRKEYNRRYYIQNRDRILRKQKENRDRKMYGKSKERDSEE